MSFDQAKMWHAIEARLDFVHWLHDDPLLRADLREVLRALPDVGRALGRIVAGRGSPRDLGQVRDGLSEARRLHDLLVRQRDIPALLAGLLPDRIEAARNDLDTARRGVDNQTIARKRDWCFALHSPQELAQLARALGLADASA